MKVVEYDNVGCQGCLLHARACRAPQWCQGVHDHGAGAMLGQFALSWRTRSIATIFDRAFMLLLDGFGPLTRERLSQASTTGISMQSFPLPERHLFNLSPPACAARVSEPFSPSSGSRRLPRFCCPGARRCVLHGTGPGRAKRSPGREGVHLRGISSHRRTVLLVAGEVALRSGKLEEHGWLPNHE